MFVFTILSPNINCLIPRTMVGTARNAYKKRDYHVNSLARLSSRFVVRIASRCRRRPRVRYLKILNSNALHTECFATSTNRGENELPTRHTEYATSLSTAVILRER